jgi:hypothetical protein
MLEAEAVKNSPRRRIAIAVRRTELLLEKIMAQKPAENHPGQTG